MAKSLDVEISTETQKCNTYMFDQIKNICHVSRLFHSELYSSAPRSLERDIVQKSKPNRAPWPLQILQVKRNEATVRLSHIDSDVRDEHGGRLEPVAESSILTRVLLDFGKMSSVVAWSKQENTGPTLCCE